MTFDDMVRMDQDTVIQTYGQRQLGLVKGEGVRVWDVQGKVYLDFLCGLGVNSLGHCHPKVVAAIREQVGQLMHVSNLYYTMPQLRLAEKLANAFGEGRCFFCNSGTEAVEAGLKLARKAREGRTGFMAMVNSFHGRTAFSLAATGQDKYRKAFEPLVPGFSYVPFNDLAAARAAAHENLAGIIVEPVQGEGGVYIADPKFLAGLRQLADEVGAILIFDEVQCGMGRCGKIFCFENYGVKPDVVCCAKALAGGFPMGAMVAKPEVAESFTRGTHASTFGGNPVACAAAVAALDVMQAEGFLPRSVRMGEHLVSSLMGSDVSGLFKEIRIKGLMIGLELSKPIAAQAVALAREKGLLANAIGDHIIRLLPPLVVSEDEIRQAVDILRASLKEACGGCLG